MGLKPECLWVALGNMEDIGGKFLFQVTGLFMKSFQQHKETLIKSSEAQGDGGATDQSA